MEHRFRDTTRTGVLILLPSQASKTKITVLSGSECYCSLLLINGCRHLEDINFTLGRSRQSGETGNKAFMRGASFLNWYTVYEHDDARCLIEAMDAMRSEHPGVNILIY
jgi:hypothetical protein